MALFVRFYFAESNPYCHEMYAPWRYEERRRCYDEAPHSNLTIYTPHYAWGTMMLVPFLLNYLICWYVWATTDKRKAVTWVAALLSFYPQFVACKIIWMIWRDDPKKGLQKKRHLERNLIQMETFVEAVPSTLVLTYLLLRRESGGAEGYEIIYGDSGNDIVLFITAFSTSVITSSLGLAKNLKVGPCHILPKEKRCFGGLFSPRFILIFFSCCFVLVAKGFTCVLAGLILGPSQEPADLASRAAFAFSTLLLPGFLTGLFACCHKEMPTTFLVHPSISLLPAFSNFTFVSNSKACCGCRGKTEDCENGQEGTQEDTFITFSPKYTAINAGLNLAGALVYIFTLCLVTKHDYGVGIPRVLLGTCALFIPGLLLTLVAAFSNQCKCCRNCCCCTSCTEPFEIGALLTSSPRTPYVLGSDGRLRKEETYEEQEEEEEEEEEGMDEDVEAAKGEVEDGGKAEEEREVEEADAEEVESEDMVEDSEAVEMNEYVRGPFLKLAIQ